MPVKVPLRYRGIAIEARADALGVDDSYDPYEYYGIDTDAEDDSLDAAESALGIDDSYDPYEHYGIDKGDDTPAEDNSVDTVEAARKALGIDDSAADDADDVYDAFVEYGIKTTSMPKLTPTEELTVTTTSAPEPTAVAFE